MRYSLLIASLALSIVSASQSKEDSRIIVKVATTEGFYQKVKSAFVQADFIVKDLPGDTISTYLREYAGMYLKAYAILDGDKVTILGTYSLKKVDYFGYNNMAKGHKPIVFYKGSKTWKELKRVASLIGGEITYKQ